MAYRNIRTQFNKQPKIAESITKMNATKSLLTTCILFRAPLAVGFPDAPCAGGDDHLVGVVAAILVLIFRGDHVQTSRNEKKEKERNHRLADWRPSQRKIEMLSSIVY